jgi:hypothetical protein
MEPLENPWLWIRPGPPRAHARLGRTRAKERPLLSPITVLIPSPVPTPMAIAVDPQVLAVAGRPLAASTGALRAALLALDAVWLASSEALLGRHTAASLEACRRAVSQTLEACAEEVERLGQALQTSSAVYAHADTATG